MPGNFLKLSITLCCVHYWLPATADDSPRLFDSHETLAVTITSPYHELDKQRAKDVSHDGTLQYTDSSGVARTLDLKLRARGKYRARHSTCGFPPVRLNFRKKQVKGTLFRGQNKLKMVTHCQNKSSLYEQYLLKEYLAYRMYQVMTDYSFRVRLLRVRWVDSANPDDTLDQYAFLIEDEERLAKRLGVSLSSATHTDVENLVPYQSVLASVYAFLIANTDFSLLRGPAGDICCHNVILLDTDAGKLPIPYDFDFSGFVNARYATPNPKFKLKSVTTRLYRGRCEHNPVLEEVFQHFRNERDKLFALIDDQEGLKSYTRGKSRRFVEGFYKLINNPKRVNSKIIKRCA